MFESLTDKLELTFKRLRGQGKISETNIDDALRDVRLALLEADVHVEVVKNFLEAVKTKSMGQEVFRSLTPEQQFIKIVRDEMVELLGGEYRDLDLKTAPPVVIMLVGLQGSGKTTTLAKLARYLKKDKKRAPYLVPADIYRAAKNPRRRAPGSGLRLQPGNFPGGDLPARLAGSKATILRRAADRHRGTAAHRRGIDAGAGGDQRVGPAAPDFVRS
jgi:signal recognition particle subunit SRP54